MSNQGNFLDYLEGNSFQVDAELEEEKLRSRYPQLLHENEIVEIAYKACGKWGRDKQFLTNKRVLLKDGKGIGGKCRNYLSIPYRSISGFSIETTGSFEDDVEVRLWCSGGLFTQTIDFANGTADIFVVQHFFNHKVFQSGDKRKRPTFSDSKRQSLSTLGDAHIDTFESFEKFLAEEGAQLDASKMEHRLKALTPVLRANEEVLLSYRCGSNVTVLTNLRCMEIKQSGHKIKFSSTRWDCIKAFSVDSSRILIHTNIWNKRYISQDLQQTNVAAVKKVLCNVLVEKKVVTSEAPVIGNLWQFAESDAASLDAAQVTQTFQESYVLESNEQAELVFRGSRNMTLFTPHRVVVVDMAALSERKLEYKRLKWSAIISFGVQISTNKAEPDSQILIWTDIMKDRETVIGDEGEIPDEEMSYLELDFVKHTIDILAVQRYLAARTTDHIATDTLMPATVVAPSRISGNLDVFLASIDRNYTPISIGTMGRELHDNFKLLMDHEKIHQAYKIATSLLVFADSRIIKYETNGVPGARLKEYISIPYSALRSFSVECCSSWNRSIIINLHTSNHWNLSKVSLDLAKCKTSAIEIQNMLTSTLLLDSYVAPTSVSQVPDGLDGNDATGFFDYALDLSVKVDPEDVNRQLHSNPKLLLKDEIVLKVWVVHQRNLWIYTNRRVLIMGKHGKRIQCETIPYGTVSGFAVETAGHLDREAELFLYNDIPSKPRAVQKLNVQDGNIFAMHSFMTSHLLFT